MVFSANLQETLGISCYEGALVDAIPLVPDRLSYHEMYYDNFKYPSEWTESFEAYQAHRPELCAKIIQYMNNYQSFVPKIRTEAEGLSKYFFTAQNLLEMLK
jgi:hypothetical protein